MSDDLIEHCAKIAQDFNSEPADFESAGLVAAMDQLDAKLRPIQKATGKAIAEKIRKLKAGSGEPRPHFQDDCVRELGYALIYMKWLRPDFANSKSGKKQKKRVHQLCMKLSHYWYRTREDTWWQSFYEEIINEIENMC